jgi:hypothetical protein
MRDSIVFAVAGMLFGVIVGWVLGSQQARGTPGPSPQAPRQPARRTRPRRPARCVPLDQERVRALEAVAQQNPKDAQPRVQLGNMYFDAEQYPEAIYGWYEQALALKTTTRICRPIWAWPTTTPTSPTRRSRSSSTRWRSIRSTPRRC